MATRLERNRPLALLLILLLLLLGARRASAQSSAVPEYQLKATFLFQFTQFVEWPAQAFSASESPLTIGILGQDPFGSFLDDTIRDENINEHPLVVERYARLEDVRNCHLLYISRAEAGRIHEIVAALNGRSVLLVSDAEGFADGGGMIQFVRQQNKMGLRINLSAARSANLTISSKLLRLATLASGTR
jgi:uncharacterized protein DUF4154